MSSTDALSAALGALFLFLFVGFLGVSDDNTQHLLAAYKLADPDFLANDWFVQETQSFHPFFEYYVLWWLKADAPVLGLFVWFAVNLLLLSAALVLWLKTLGMTRRMPFAAIVAAAIIVVGVTHGWGHYEIIADKSQPAYLAYPTALIAIALLLHRRFLSSACAVAITFVIHHGLGALLALCMIGPFLATLPRSRREAIRVALGGLLVVAVFMPSVLATIDLDVGHAEDFRIFFYGRAPNHYAVQYSSLSTHLASLHIFGVCLLLTSMLASRTLRTQIFALVVSVAVLCLLGYLLLEVWYVPAFVRLFPYRALPILVAVNACLIAYFLLSRSAGRMEFLTAVATLLAALAFRYSLPVWAVLLAVAVVLRCLPRGTAPGASVRRAGLVFVCIAGSAALLVDRFLHPPQYFLEPISQRYAPLGRAIEALTPSDSILVVPPWITGARLITNRAIVVNFKAFPVYASEMAEWADRMRDISGVDPRDAKQYLDMGANVWRLYAAGYQERTVDDLAAAARRYGAAFLLVSTRSRFHGEAEKAGLPALWSGYGLVLYRTPEAPR